MVRGIEDQILSLVPGCHDYLWSTQNNLQHLRTIWKYTSLIFCVREKKLALL